MGVLNHLSDPSRGFCIYMKISDMSKADLVNYMRASHELVRYDRNSSAWKRAFQLARKGGLESVEMDCQSCVNKVKTWLEK